MVGPFDFVREVKLTIRLEIICRDWAPKGGGCGDIGGRQHDVSTA